MIDVIRIDVRAPGVALVTVSRTRSQQRTTLWARSKARKTHRCVQCERSIAVGDYAYRTLNNTDYRMFRLCESCVDREEART